MCVAVQMTTLGMPVIYYGEEVARGGSEWPLNRNDMPWGEQDIRPGKGVARDEAMRAYYKQLIALRKSHPALTRGDFQLLTGAQDPALAYVRHDAQSKDSVLVIANRGDTPLAVSHMLPASWVGDAMADAVSDERLHCPRIASKWWLPRSRCEFFCREPERHRVNGLDQLRQDQ